MASDLIAGQLVRWLLESALATSAAMLAVLALRKPVRRTFGAGVGYALWLLVPAAWLAVLLPAPVREVAIAMPRLVRGVIGPGTAQPGAAIDHDVLRIAIASVWMLGACLMLATEYRQQRTFLHRLGPLTPRGDGLLQAQATACLPAVVGLRARIVLPADFDARYSAAERRLILAHERTHVHRGDLPVQVALLVFRSLYWFNPLAWLAVERVRRDQELAVDASVIARHPDARRTYGEAMVKITLGHAFAPLACQWVGIHPLKERITMLKNAIPSRRTRVSGLFIVASLALGTAGAAWALQTPETRIAPRPMDAPGTRIVNTSTFDESIPQPFRRTIALSMHNMPMSEAALRAAALADVNVANVKALPAKTITFDFAGVPVVTIMTLIAEDAGMAAEYTGDTVRFVPPKPKAPGTENDRPAAPVTRLPAPAYPAAALAAKQSGWSVLQIDVAANGDVTGVAVVQSRPAGVFDTSAIEAARQWKFSPEIKNGKPVASRIVVPVDFQSEGDDHVTGEAAAVAKTKAS